MFGLRRHPLLARKSKSVAAKTMTKTTATVATRCERIMAGLPYASKAMNNENEMRNVSLPRPFAFSQWRPIKRPGGESVGKELLCPRALRTTEKNCLACVARGAAHTIPCFTPREGVDKNRSSNQTFSDANIVATIAYNAPLCRDATPAATGRVERWRGGLGAAYRLPARSSAGASLAAPCFVSTSRSSAWANTVRVTAHNT